MASLDVLSAKYQHPGNAKYPCEIRFDDPGAEVIGDLNEIMLAAGFYAAENWKENVTSLIDDGLSVEQIVQAKRTQHLAVFVSDLRWVSTSRRTQCR